MITTCDDAGIIYARIPDRQGTVIGDDVAVGGRLIHTAVEREAVQVEGDALALGDHERRIGIHRLDVLRQPDRRAVCRVIDTGLQERPRSTCFIGSKRFFVEAFFVATLISTAVRVRPIRHIPDENDLSVSFIRIRFDAVGRLRPAQDDVVRRTERSVYSCIAADDGNILTVEPAVIGQASAGDGHDSILVLHRSGQYCVAAGDRQLTTAIDRGAGTALDRHAATGDIDISQAVEYHAVVAGGIDGTAGDIRFIFNGDIRCLQRSAEHIKRARIHVRLDLSADDINASGVNAQAPDNALGLSGSAVDRQRSGSLQVAVSELIRIHVHDRAVTENQLDVAVEVDTVRDTELTDIVSVALFLFNVVPARGQLGDTISQLSRLSRLHVALFVDVFYLMQSAEHRCHGDIALRHFKGIIVDHGLNAVLIGIIQRRQLAALIGSGRQLDMLASLSRCRGGGDRSVLAIRDIDIKDQAEGLGHRVFLTGENT